MSPYVLSHSTKNKIDHIQPSLIIAHFSGVSTLHPVIMRDPIKERNFVCTSWVALNNSKSSILKVDLYESVLKQKNLC